VPFIEIASVSKSFGSRHVLHDVSLSVQRGEFVTIVGGMGCGKSTLLNIASGLIPPDAGTVTVAGGRAKGIRKDASIVFQNYSLLPWFSAVENVRLAINATFPEWTKDRQKQQASKYLDMVGLGNALHRRPGALSGGMRQRVAIARAFATEPDILFLDEPFGALDALTRGSLQQELIRMCSARDKPVTVVMISNNVDEAILLSDRIVPMTRAPKATLGCAVPVDLAKPRTHDLLLHDLQAEKVRGDIIASLTETRGVVRTAGTDIRAAGFSILGSCSQSECDSEFERGAVNVEAEA
jgi:nitrate/nitrite transport system ATP-binding protein